MLGLQLNWQTGDTIYRTADHNDSQVSSDKVWLKHILTESITVRLPQWPFLLSYHAFQHFVTCKYRWNLSTFYKKVTNYDFCKSFTKKITWTPTILIYACKSLVSRLVTIWKISYFVFLPALNCVMKYCPLQKSCRNNHKCDNTPCIWQSIYSTYPDGRGLSQWQKVLSNIHKTLISTELKSGILMLFTYFNMKERCKT